MKSIMRMFIPFDLRIEIHIIPASAPNGVIFAAKLEPIVVASAAMNEFEPA
jgi:hypothetical protein